MQPNTPIPVPRDLYLSLPLPPDVLQILAVVLFIVHIAFVNLMMGGALLTVFFEMIGQYQSRYDALSRTIADTITVNKSLAVVFGVGPLLCLNLLYTLSFYSANALTGYAWISLVPLIATAFLITYVHKYTWDRWTGSAKSNHILIGGLGAGLFLFIPLIFLTNINLMLFPEKWPEIRGFFSAIQIGNVFPRYFHFLSASLALTGLFLAGWLGREKKPLPARLSDFSKPELRRIFLLVTLYATMAQLLLGPLVLLTLPKAGLTPKMVWTILAGLVVALIPLGLLILSIRNPKQNARRFYWPICASLSVVILLMATGRHLYREAGLQHYNQLVTHKTSEFRAIETAMHMRLADPLLTTLTGKDIFKTCASCHAVDKVRAAPPIREIYTLYRNNPEGIVKWAMNPGKKRPEFGQMPTFKYLGEDNLKLAAEYMLSLVDEESVQN